LRKRVFLAFGVIFLVLLVAGGMISRNMGKLQTVNQARGIADYSVHLIDELDRIAEGTVRVLDEILWDETRIPEIQKNLRRTSTLIGRLDEIVISESLIEKGCAVCHERPEKFARDLRGILDDMGVTSRELTDLAGLLENPAPRVGLYPLIGEISQVLDQAQQQFLQLRNSVLPMVSHTETQVARSIQTIGKNHIMIMLLSALMLLGSFLVLSVAVAWPVNQLAEGTEAIVQGNYGHRVRIKGKNEAVILAERFNTMAQVIESREKSLLQQKMELESLNESLERKVQERTRQLQASRDELRKNYRELEVTNSQTRSSFLKLQATTEELETAKTKLQDNFNVLKVMNKELKRANEVKNKFLSIMSHELRTPLTVINGYLSLVLEKDYGHPSQELKEILTVVKEQSRSQLSLIEELLDLTRIESGEFKLHREALSVKELIGRAVENFHPRFQENEFDLTVWVDPAIPAVYWDFQKILQVIQNLFDNSVKFTPAGGEIGISAQFKNAFVEISIRDSGIGIPQDQIPHIFDRFYQGDSSSTRQFGGSGLGLSIVQEIVQAHQGKIFVESGEGKGTCFLILLPLGGRDWARKQERSDPAAALPQRQAPKGQGEKILVVDDDEAFLRMMKMLLPKEGYEAHTTSQPQKALGEAKKQGSDLIILDLMMPLVDGFEICRRIRRDRVLKDKPILVVSAAGGMEVAQKVTEAGADAQITKPFNQVELLNEIGRLLKKRGDRAPGNEGKRDLHPDDP